MPIGYTVIHDKWHEESVEFIETSTEPIYWSNLVEEEYDEPLEDITSDLIYWLNYITEILKNNENDFDSYYNFEKYILIKTKSINIDDTKKRKILEKFWQKNNFNYGISTIIYSNFLKYSHDFKKIYSMRMEKLKKMLILHDCGLDNYQNYYKYATALNNASIHNPDYKIIVDAHDCGLKHGYLTFITKDGKMLDALSKINTFHLAIIEFKSYNN